MGAGARTSRSADLRLQGGRPGAAAASRHRVVVVPHRLRHRAATWAAENGRSELAGRLHHYAEGRVAATWAARSDRRWADGDRRVHWSHGPVGGGKSADRMTGSLQCRCAARRVAASGDSQYRPAMPPRLGQPSKARDPYRTAAARRIADACPRPLPEALDHRPAVQRDDLLGPAGPVHEGRQILPGVPGQPPVFDHAGR